jgi:hypothetical protein
MEIFAVLRLIDLFWEGISNSYNLRFRLVNVVYCFVFLGLEFVDHELCKRNRAVQEHVPIHTQPSRFSAYLGKMEFTCIRSSVLLFVALSNSAQVSQGSNMPIIDRRGRQKAHQVPIGNCTTRYVLRGHLSHVLSGFLSTLSCTYVAHT